MDQDPKNMIPMTCIGELWRGTVLLLYVLCYVAVPTLSVAAILELRRRHFVAGSITAACVGITLLFMLGFSPDYVLWLLD